jgi:hypothetical protein
MRVRKGRGNIKNGVVEQANCRGGKQEGANTLEETCNAHARVLQGETSLIRANGPLRQLLRA